MSLEARVDEDVCIGAANCVAAAPQAFELDDDGIARPVAGVADLDDTALVLVARSCPSGAVELFRGTEQVDVFAAAP